MVEQFMARFTKADAAFIRARFFLRVQVEPEAITPELDDPALEAQIERTIEEIDREIERLNATGPRRSGAGSSGGATSSTLKPLKKPGT
jgi:hypothetical protein